MPAVGNRWNGSLNNIGACWSNSLNIVLAWEGIEEGYKFGMCNDGPDGGKVTMPLFMAMLL